MKKLLLSLFAVLLSCSAWSYDVKIDGIYYFFNKTKKEASVTCENTNYNSYSGDVFIPSSVTYSNVTYSVTSIKDWAFCICEGLTSIEIPNSVTSIGDRAFNGCSGLTSIEIPNSVTSIGSYAFFNCTNLKSIKLPNNVTSIGKSAFNRCTVLTSIEIPNSVTEIDNATFYECTSLTSVEIPNSVISIGDWAFNYCSGLTYVTIPNSVKSIGEGAFYGCKSLNSITCEAVIPPTLGSGYEVFYDVDKTACILYVPAESLDAYKSADQWKDFANIKALTFKLTYYVDGEVYKTYDVKSGTTITPIAEPSKEGYTFSGWSEIPETMPAEDVTVVGSFTVNSYKLIYKVDGEEYKIIETEYGLPITPIDEPTKEGYTFSGWSWIPSKMPAEDVTVAGSFTVNSYKLTYFVDGEEYQSTTVKYGDAITPIDEPKKEGFIFSGWSEIPEIMPAKDVIVEGTFTPDTTGLDGITADSEEIKAYFNINGQPISALQKGMNIVKKANGQTMKVFVK